MGDARAAEDAYRANPDADALMRDQAAAAHEAEAAKAS